MVKKIVFMGTPDFSVPILEKLYHSTYEIVLVVTQPDRPKGRRRVLTPPPVKKLAQQYDIPVFQPEKIAGNDEFILSYEPDIIITAAYGQILPKTLLEAPPYGCINVHASLLPELRGGAPIHYAILQGKKETGVTIMNMVEALDAGDILMQEKVSIKHTDDVGVLHDKLSKVGADLLLQTLPQLFAGKLTPIPQDDEQATFAPNITRDVEKINWQQRNEDIYNHIRGLRPWPVAYTTYEQKQLKIFWAMIDHNVYNGHPGEIASIQEDSFTVVCGNQRGLCITEIQPAGSKRMTVAEFLRGAGNWLTKGMILGD